MNKNVYIVNPSSQYTTMFLNHGWVVVDKLENASLVCFTGGEDVSPYLYGESCHPHTHYNARRDNNEIFIYGDAIAKDIPCVGICRGGQFLNVLNGGKMYQHVNKHCGDHLAYNDDEEAPVNILYVTSTHHQMMRPGPSSVVLLYAKEEGWKEHMAGTKAVVRVENDAIDIESVFYPNTLSLCFQPHPEFYGEERLQELFFFFVNKYLIKE